jgi:hypothetical protein
LWEQGLEIAGIAAQLGITWTAAQSRARRLHQRGLIQPRPRGGGYLKQRAQRRQAGTPSAHPSIPTGQHTQAHQGVPVPNDLAVCLLSLLPDLEVIVARERDRQRLMSTPVGTPQDTVKKTYVVDALYVDLVERYPREERLELKDVVNLAFHEFIERRQYLPEEKP